VKTIIAAIMVAGFATTALPRSTGLQEVKHAPTAAQCQADARLWLSKLEDMRPSSLADVSYFNLSDWQSEMSDCKPVDPENVALYQNVSFEAVATRMVRLRDFLIRHNLLDQFTKEDAAGIGR
jgi:hypothetical protein